MGSFRDWVLLIAGVAGMLLADSSAWSAALTPPGLSAVLPVGELLLTFDDMGNGTIAVGGGLPSNLPGLLVDDPANPACPSTCAPALTYFLPESVVSGDVAILAPDGTDIAAWLRFTDDAGTISGADTGPGERLIFYFDSQFPSNIGLENLIIGPTEVITDGMATFDYRPGGVPYPENNEYIGSITVATVSEPASLILLASGMAVTFLFYVRRRRL
jgi:hypothetical protein